MLVKTWRSRAQKMGALALLTVLTLTGCATASGQNGLSEEFEGRLDELGLSGKTGKQVIDTLDALPVSERPQDMFASVLSDSLELTLVDAEGGAEETTSLPLPEDEFYVSLAPFVQQTHACHFHSLTTCLGELSRESLQVRVTDAATDEVVFDKGVESFDNGFFGLWLPRNGEFEVAVESDLGDGALIIGTGNEDPTCVTTLQLDSNAEALGAL